MSHFISLFHELNDKDGVYLIISKKQTNQQTNRKMFSIQACIDLCITRLACPHSYSQTFTFSHNVNMNLQSLDSAVSAPRPHYFSFNKNQQDLNKLTGQLSAVWRCVCLCMLWVGRTLLWVCLRAPAGGRKSKVIPQRRTTPRNKLINKQQHKQFDCRWAINPSAGNTSPSVCLHSEISLAEDGAGLQRRSETHPCKSCAVDAYILFHPSIITFLLKYMSL